MNLFTEPFLTNASTLIQRDHLDKRHRITGRTDAPDGSIALILESPIAQGFGFRYYLEDPFATAEVELKRVSLTKPCNIVVQKLE